MDMKGPEDVNVSGSRKPCRACSDFKSWMRAPPGLDSSAKEVKKENTEAVPVVPNTSSMSMFAAYDNNDELGSRGSAKAKQKATSPIAGTPFSGLVTSQKDQNQNNSTTELKEETAPTQDGNWVPSWGMGKKFGCPADSVELGRGSWRLLHSIAAYYPDKPSDETQTNMKSFISLFSKFYPCWHCAEDFREWLKSNPPDVSSQGSLSKFFCLAHNDVNRKLGKPEFDCSLLNQRWLDGWNDGSCD